MAVRALFIFFFLFSGARSFAEVRWNESPLWRSAQVLPQGQHRWSARVGEQTIKNRYDQQGETVPLGGEYTQKWSWGDLVNAQTDKKGQDEIVQYMKRKNISSSEEAASSGFGIERDETNFDFSWAYGMTSRWMFGFYVPFSRITTKVRSEVSVDARAAEGFKSISAQNQEDHKDIEQTVREMVRNEVARQGFREIPAERTQWIWGDVSLLNQFLLSASPDSRWSLQQVLRMPTSRNPSLSDFAMASRDEGQIDVGLSSFYERNFGPTLGILGLGYVNQWKGPVRVTEFDAQGSRLPGDKEVDRDLGDVWWAGIESRWSLSSSVRLSGAYRYFHKDADRWKSGVPALVTTGKQEAHLARMVVSYAFSGAEKHFDIEKKWLLNFQLQSDLAGVNSDRFTSGALELQTYF